MLWIYPWFKFYSLWFKQITLHYRAKKIENKISTEDTFKIELQHIYTLMMLGLTFCRCTCRHNQDDRIRIGSELQDLWALIYAQFLVLDSKPKDRLVHKIKFRIKARLQNSPYYCVTKNSWTVWGLHGSLMWDSYSKPILRKHRLFCSLNFASHKY